MFSSFDPLRDLTFAAVTARMVLAFLCGGAIGIEREYKRRPAGFRTHILICLGAAMTTLTSQYLVLEMHYYTDMARLGAQVIAGVGFIGAGTIVVTRKQRVKGLTTAAGLWVSAIIGLTLGAGFYEGGIWVTVLVLVAELVLSKLERRIVKRTPEVDLYLEYSHKQSLDAVMQYLKANRIRMTDLEVTRLEGREDGVSACAVVTLRLPGKMKPEEVSRGLNAIGGITAVDELISV